MRSALAGGGPFLRALRPLASQEPRLHWRAGGAVTGGLRGDGAWACAGLMQSSTLKLQQI